MCRRHNPDAPGAVVMKSPTKEHQARFNKKSVAENLH